MSEELCGKLVVLSTDELKVCAKSADKSRFVPGTEIYWIPTLKNNVARPAIILADLRLAGYDDFADKKSVKALSGMPDEWTMPAQFVEAEYIAITE